MIWRAMETFDLPNVKALADRIHPSFPEDIDIFSERLLLYPAGMFLLEAEGEPVGYAIAHPWRRGSLPALNCHLGGLPHNPDSLYLHDLALLPVARGKGVARLIIDEIKQHAMASGYHTMGLVAVNGSVPFWRRQGFEIENNEDVAEKLASYGPDARLMFCTLSSSGSELVAVDSGSS